YLDASHKILGVIPTQQTLVLERFFDEAGGMQLVLHAPFGSRVNRAWGLALRKRFCRSFNFELQAAATEDAIVISLGPHHSFPLDDVFQYLKPATAEQLLVQAMLDAPMFGTRWRWNATRALAVLRVLEEMDAGRCRLVARDTTEPSPLSHEVINAKPYAFLDDAPLEERRTQAVITRRGLDVKTAEELGRLDQAAIDRVRDEAWPEATSADELHDALLVMGVIPNAEVGTRNAEQRAYFEELARAGRAGTLLLEPRLCVAAERLPM